MGTMVFKNWKPICQQPEHKFHMHFGVKPYKCILPEIPG